MFTTKKTVITIWTTPKELRDMADIVEATESVVRDSEEFTLQFKQYHQGNHDVKAKLDGAGAAYKP